jgi:hypothetical protein
MQTSLKSRLRKAGCLLSFLLMTVVPGFPGWEQLPPLPGPNGGFACGALGNKIVVLGGTNWKDNTKQWLDVIWVFDPASRKWEAHGKLPQPLAYAVTGEWQGDLILAGGTDGGQPRNEVWRLKSSLELDRVGQLQEAVALVVGGTLDDSLFVLGGCADPVKLDGLRKGGERMKLSNGEGSAFPLPGNVAFGLGASVGGGRELFLFGGAMHDPVAQVVNLRAAWAYEAGKDKWRSIRPYPFAVRGASAVRLDEHHILIAGGFGGEPADFMAAAFIYDARRDTYSKTMDLPVAALIGLVRAGDFIYSLGGEDKMKHRTAACFRVKAKELFAASRANLPPR